MWNSIQLAILPSVTDELKSFWLNDIKVIVIVNTHMHVLVLSQVIMARCIDGTNEADHITISP